MKPVGDKNLQYRADYNNRPSHAISFMPAFNRPSHVISFMTTSKSGCLHGEFVILLSFTDSSGNWRFSCSFRSSASANQLPLPPHRVLPSHISRRSRVGNILARMWYYGLYWILMGHLQLLDHTLNHHTLKTLALVFHYTDTHIYVFRLTLDLLRVCCSK
jgi:hypothetical protein